MPDLVPLASSMILALGWDEETLRMVVQFGENNYFEYLGVPAEIAARVIYSPSKGRAFTTQVKQGGFAYQRITRAQAEE